MESGNLCGATTVFLAFLKRAFCPACPLYSVDPGIYRGRVGQLDTCARSSLEWAGVAGDVQMLDALSASVEVELPVGFIVSACDA